MSIGQKIQNARKKKGISQEEFANLLNVSRQAVQKWESDASSPETNKLSQISKILNVSLDYLLNDETTEEEPPVKKEKQESASTIQAGALDEHRINVIKVWLIIGCVLTPLALGGSILKATGAIAFTVFILYAFTIPMCVGSIRCMRKAKNKSDIIGWGVLSLIFVSFIGGLLMLVTKDEHFSSSKGTLKAETSTDGLTKTTKAKDRRQDKLNHLIDNGLVRLSKTTTPTISEKDKVTIKSKLLNIKKKIPECEDDQTMYLLETEIKDALTLLNKRRNKKILIGVAVTAVAAVVITISIVVPINVNRERKWDAELEELKTLVYNYDPANDNRINDLLWDLRNHRDIYEIEKEFRNVSNYTRLLNTISDYQGNQASSVTSFLSGIDDNYKKKTAIQSEFNSIKSYYSSITYRPTDSACKYCDNSTALTNRTAIENSYKANKTGLWGFQSTIAKIDLPDLICGTEVSCGEYSFKFYEGAANDNTYHLSWNLPCPSPYDPAKQYYFTTSYSYQKNVQKFKLQEKTNPSVTFDLFKVEAPKWNLETKKFNCTVYLNGDSSTRTFAFE